MNWIAIFLHESKILLLSVATIQLFILFVFITCFHTKLIIGSPLIIANGLPGNRDELHLAGITAKTFNFVYF